MTTRRSILVGLAAACAAAASPSNGASRTSENPELLELADALPGIAKEQEHALRKCQEMARDAELFWPRATEAIRIGGYGSDVERDITGHGYSLREDKPSRQFDGKRVCTREGIQSLIASEKREYAKVKDNPRRQPKAARLKERIDRYENEVAPQVEAYWSECERLKKAFRAEEVIGATAATREALHVHVDKIMSAREQSMVGLAIKAQALEAWGRVPRFYQAFNLQGDAWAQEMAASILRQADVGLS